MLTRAAQILTQGMIRIGDAVREQVPESGAKQRQ
jgi:hypothetical protein